MTAGRPSRDRRAEDRRAADQPRHAGRARGAGGAALSRRVPERSASDRNPGDRVEADPPRDHPAHPAEASRPKPTTRSGPTKARRCARSPRRQAEALRTRLPSVSVHYAMRYGHPGIAAAIEQHDGEGCTRILAAPLYPQYCAATTATANDAVFGALARMRWQPALRTLPPYYDDPLYIDALATNVEAPARGARFRARAAAAELPRNAGQRTLELGDPYHCHCRKTARLLGEALGREVDVAFQSRFGRAKWLEPATDATLAGLSEAGREAHRSRCAGLFGRLHRDAGRARDSRARDLPSKPAASSSRCSIASTIRPKASPCWSA